MVVLAPHLLKISLLDAAIMGSVVAAVSPAVAAAPPADVASGESTPPLQDAVPPVAAAAAGEAGPLPPHARMQSDDPQKNKADIKK